MHLEFRDALSKEYVPRASGLAEPLAGCKTGCGERPLEAELEERIFIHFGDAGGDSSSGRQENKAWHDAYASSEEHTGPFLVCRL